MAKKAAAALWHARQHFRIAGIWVSAFGQQLLDVDGIDIPRTPIDQQRNRLLVE